MLINHQLLSNAMLFKSSEKNNNDQKNRKKKKHEHFCKIMCATSPVNYILHIVIHRARISCASKKAIVICDLPLPSYLNAYQKAEKKTACVYSSARYRVIVLKFLQCGFLGTHIKHKTAITAQNSTYNFVQLSSNGL